MPELTVLLCGVKYLSEVRVSFRHIAANLDLSIEVLLRQIETTRPAIGGSERAVQIEELGVANFPEILSRRLIISLKTVEISESVVADIGHFGSARRRVAPVRLDHVLIALAVKVASLSRLRDVATNIASVILDLEEIVLDQLTKLCFCNRIISRSQRRFDPFPWISFIVFGEKHIHKDDQANGWYDYSKTKLLQGDEHILSQNTLVRSVFILNGRKQSSF